MNEVQLNPSRSMASKLIWYKKMQLLAKKYVQATNCYGIISNVVTYSTKNDDFNKFWLSSSVGRAKD
ncbi:hypothetical protein [Mesobacillus stamsii]|uniref:hypothetical protein n=1 Tax=Mesobacillus stamsii TaxID=225347 RepID=UPI0027D87FA9|nr:hypothetical protein [Mesobacillus stamsii]